MKTRQGILLAALIHLVVLGLTFGVWAEDAVTQSESTVLTGTTSGELTSELSAQSAVVPRPTASQDEVETLTPVTFDASSVEAQSPSSALYAWDFNGDGEPDAMSTVPMLRHTFETAGTYSVRVRVTDDAGTDVLSDAVEIAITNRAPQASFSVASELITDLASIEFEDASVDPDGLIVAWSWSFGDGTQSTERSPFHSYSVSGEYDVTLTVVDNSGISSEPYTETIRIENTPPVASFDGPSTAEVGESVVFVDRSIDPTLDGAIVHVAWDFGDGSYVAGTTSAATTYVHAYVASGDYRVTLYVIDNAGGLDTKTSTIRVTAGP